MSNTKKSKSIMKDMLACLEDIKSWEQNPWRAYGKLYGLGEKLRVEQAKTSTFRKKKTACRDQAVLDRFSQWLKENGVDLEESGLKVELVRQVASIAPTNGEESSSPNGDDEDAIVVASKPIPKGDVLFRIPRSLFLGADQAWSSELGITLVNLLNSPLPKKSGSKAGSLSMSSLSASEKLGAEILLSIPSLLLSVFVLMQLAKGDKSKFGPYLQALPNKFHVPLFYTPEELKALDSSHLFIQALKRARNHYKQYVHLYDFVERVRVLPVDDFSLEAFDWAVGVVMTRQNMVPSEMKSAGCDDHNHGGHNHGHSHDHGLDRQSCGSNDHEHSHHDHGHSHKHEHEHEHDSEPSLCLVPGWDMMNHMHGIPTTDFNEQLQCVEFSAMADSAPGEPVNMFYGSRPNAELLLYSGFVYPGNPYDYVPVHLDFPADDPLRKARILLLQKLMEAAAATAEGKGDAPSTKSSNLVPTSQFQLSAQITAERGVDQVMILFSRVAHMNKEDLADALRDIKKYSKTEPMSIDEYGYVIDVCQQLLLIYPDFILKRHPDLNLPPLEDSAEDRNMLVIPNPNFHQQLCINLLNEEIKVVQKAMAEFEAKYKAALSAKQNEALSHVEEQASS